MGILAGAVGWQGWALEIDRPLKAIIGSGPVLAFSASLFTRT